MPFEVSHVRYGIVKDHVKCRCLAVMFSQVNKAAYLIKLYKYAIVRLFPGPMYFTINHIEYSRIELFSSRNPQNLLRSAESE